MRFLLAGLLVCCTTEATVPRGVPNDAAIDVIQDVALDTALPAPRVGTLRVAALNVHLLFDSVCDSGDCSGPMTFESVPSEAEIETRTSLIAERLASLRASIVCVEEVETQALLDRVAEKMPGYVTHTLGEIGRAATIDVGVLSTLPLADLKHHYGEALTRPDGTPTGFARDLLESHFLVDGKRAIVFCAHFKAKSGDDPGRRLAEATATREHMKAVAAEYPGALVVLGGDLNDEPGSPPLLALDEALSRVSVGLPDSQIASWWFRDGRGIAIDHLYVGDGSRYEKGTFRVAHDEAGKGFADSDHAAVLADFN